MKKFILIFSMILFILVSCGTSKYVSQRTVYDTDEISYVLSNYYPQLYTYYLEGLLRVNYIKEVVLPDNNLDYKISYDFVRYYFSNQNEKLDVVRNNYPELYQMYLNGVIYINTVYKYVDRNSGIIRYHVSYSRIRDYYYNYYYPHVYGRSRIYYHYHPRPVPPPPAHHRPVPKPKPGPGHNPPPPNNNVRPDNGNHNPSGTVNRPPSRPSGGSSHTTTRPSGSRSSSSSMSRSSGGSSSSRSGSSSARSGGSSSSRRR